MDALTYASIKHGLAIAGLFLLMSVSLAWNARSDEDWTQRLTSTQISTYSLSDAEPKPTTTIDLCPNGEYSLSDRSRIEAGKWDVVDGNLRLKNAHGAIKEYELYQGMDPDILVLGGEAHRLSRDAVCR